MSSAEALIRDLESDDWEVRAAAAEQLRNVPGAHITDALARALESDDTAVTQAAVDSLLARDDPRVADLLWQALTTLDEDLVNHIWMFLEFHPTDPVTLELQRRYDSAAAG